MSDHQDEEHPVVRVDPNSTFGKKRHKEMAMPDTQNKKKTKYSKQQRPLQGKKLSHALSWALRHAAPSIGLPMTPDGFVPVSAFLDSNHPRLKGISSVETIQDVVDHNDKKRFQLTEKPTKEYDGFTTVASTPSDTILCIRACQGHSISTIDSDLLLHRLTPDELRQEACIVHGTYLDPWTQAIRKKGLSKMKRTQIHFATGLPQEGDIISGMRRTCTVYIYVNAKKCAEDGIAFSRSHNGVLLTAGTDGMLVPEYFSHVTDNEGKILFDNRSQRTEGE